MPARGRPRCLRLRHGPGPSVQQRRLLNHFISQAPEPTESAEPPPPPPHRFTLAVKDNIATSAPHPTTCASPFLAGYHSPFEATIVTQLRARGARLVGTTNLDEFGMGSHSTHSAFGAVAQDPSASASTSRSISDTNDNNNARDGGPPLLFSAGGSSGGSAVAVASGAADVALGTDTGGSVRLPAAYCAVVGFKPSYGMLSRFGVVPYANSLDTVGLLARAVGVIRRLVVGSGQQQQQQPQGRGLEGGEEEVGGLWREGDPRDPTALSVAARERCASVRDGYAGELDADGAAQKLRGLRLGIPLEYNIAELDPRIRDAWAAAAKVLQDGFGARVVLVSLPSTRHALSAYYVIAPAEASSNLAKYDGVRYGTRDTESGSDAAGGVLYAASRGRGFGDEVKRRILLGSYTLSSEAMDNYFIQAQRVRRLVRRDFNRVFALDNPLHERETFDLADLDEGVAMEDKWGPEEVDFLLCPTAPTLAPTLEDVMSQTPVDAYMNDVFTVPASLAGLPAISIPMPIKAETGADGPERHATAGLQLIGQYWDDARLLAVAEAVSNVLGDAALAR
ncbi:682452fd-8cdf-4588-8b2d-21d4aabf58d0 [Thermothielavioides terrestris]|uniref:Glutamyl-tRNA(Gln) amidotransferase subunit A, mitochondrial n=1 Tax=Thermothielavioides terrestris TaxID=2587410 RepID=A0A3S5CW36_9PEZI|nr:682452fd-8cdf-4588-8b2d-21d4aabf58d0 [Thermothielavioides terrestris]